MTDKLLPCPFCSKSLVENTEFSTRTQKHFGHPVLEDEEAACTLETIVIIVSDHEQHQERVAAWNRRDFSPGMIIAGVVAQIAIAPSVHENAFKAGFELCRAVSYADWREAYSQWAETPPPSDRLAIGGNHPDAQAVDRFAAAMKAKLARKRAEGRSGWDDPEQCHIDYLHQLLHEQFHERTVIDPVDIANLAMMIHERSPSDD